MTIKTVDAGVVITEVFKMAASRGTVSHAFRDLIKGLNGDLTRDAMSHIASGIKQGMTCCGHSPEVQIARDVDTDHYSLFIRCPGCGASTAFKGDSEYDV